MDIILLEMGRPAFPLPPKGSTYLWLIAVHAIVYSYEYGIRFFPKGVVHISHVGYLTILKIR